MLRSLLLSLVALFVFVCVLGCATSSAPDDSNPSRTDARDTTTDAVFEAASDVFPPSPMCGNGRLEAGEACDDGNTQSGDGCRSDCQRIETDWICPQPGMPCRTTAVCGDGRIGGAEQCDDRNTTSGDGCSSTCTVEMGWTCPLPGVACRAARCGDGLRVGIEDCDDGNNRSGDGCSNTCTLEDGFHCPTPGSPCQRIQCGDRLVQGTEQCDDGNALPGDGCFECRREPTCRDTTGCTTQCGDGVLLAPEQCDDGNTRDHDGCSARCTIEPGYRCEMLRAMEPTFIRVPIVYRDFRGRDLPMGHPDFEWNIASERGIVADTLSMGKPVYARASGGTITTNGRMYFDQWYRDVPGVNITIVDRLQLNRIGPGIYQFCNSAFFPLDGRGWVAMGREPTRTNGHNFHFTSEVHYWFQYAGGERLDFTGDDDVWVFINGRLAVDLGGVHGAESGSVTLDAATATRFGLIVGRVYEIVVFQAERHTVDSNYRLTLGGFNLPRSRCASVCGDGVVTPDEACDDGTNDGRYGGCMPGCLMRAPHCGDGVLQRDQGEQCDDGNMVNEDGCSSRCQTEVIG